MAKRNIEELINSLKENKDAVIIVGNQSTKEIITNEDGTEQKINMFFEPTEDTFEIFSRKTMVKEPKRFWEFYNNEILKNKIHYIPETYKKIVQLTGTNLIKTVIDFNCDGILMNLDNVKYISIKGNRNILQCVKCKELINIDSINLNTEKALIHKNCGNTTCEGKLRPTIPFFNDKYEQKYVSDIFKSIFKYDENDNVIGLNTHNLILIGVDFTEDIIDEIIEGFNRFKRQDNAFSVFITDNEDMYMNAYAADFGTTYDISESIDKLCKLL